MKKIAPAGANAQRPPFGARIRNFSAKITGRLFGHRRARLEAEKQRLGQEDFEQKFWPALMHSTMRWQVMRPLIGKDVEYMHPRVHARILQELRFFDQACPAPPQPKILRD